MMLPAQGKLVRDRIPDIIRASGRDAHTVQLDGPDYRKALDRKLMEETAELIDANTEAKVEELADVYEVLLAIAADLGVPWTTVVDTATTKRAERGGFEARHWLLA